MTTLFFDLDGTLLDTQAGIAGSIRHALSELGHPGVSEEQLKRCFGPPLRHSFAQLLDTDEQALIIQAVTLFRRHYLNHGINTYAVYPGIIDLLEQLCQNQARSQTQNNNPVTMHILTAKPQKQAEWLITHSGLEVFFNSVYGSEDNGIKSNKSSHLAMLLNETDIPKESCWMVGDRDSDIFAAKDNGIGSVAVHWGYGDRQELNQSESDHHISIPQQLLPLLSR